jgi:glycosyltransferase involved in cell wall biosynthesis
MNRDLRPHDPVLPGDSTGASAESVRNDVLQGVDSHEKTPTRSGDVATMSVVIITKNEAHNIGDCIASIRSLAYEVIVVDSGSTDDTVAIARTAGAKVVETSDWPGFGPQKNRALSYATGEWVLSIDADERVTEAGRTELAAILALPSGGPAGGSGGGLAGEMPGRLAGDITDGPAGDRADALAGGPVPSAAYALPRLSQFCGRWVRHSGWYPDYVTRLFRRGTARFSDDLVHERIDVEGTVDRLREPLHHYSYLDHRQVEEKIDRYAQAGAEQLFRRGKRYGPLKPYFAGGWAWIRTWVLRAGFLDGAAGSGIAAMNARSTTQKYLRLRGMHHKRMPPCSCS